CDMQIFVDARRLEIAEGKEQRPSADTVHKAEAVLRHVNIAKTAAPGPAYTRAANVYRWLGQSAEAIAELERGIAVAPGDETLNAAFLKAYIDMDRRQECVSAYKRLLRENGRGKVLMWNLGRAQQALADDHRAKGRYDEAATAYREAES